MLISLGAFSQGVVKGRVVDSLSAEVLSFTNVGLYSVEQHRLVTGNVTDDKGEFRIEVPYGKYTAERLYGPALFVCGYEFVFRVGRAAVAAGAAEAAGGCGADAGGDDVLHRGEL